MIASVFGKNEVNQAFTNLKTCIDEVTNANVWNGESSQSFKKMAQKNIDLYGNNIAKQIENLSNAITKYNEYEKNKNLIASKEKSLLSIEDENYKSAIEDEIKSLVKKNNQLKKEIIDLLKAVSNGKIETTKRFTEYNQYDYPDVEYGDTIALSGCGVTSMAMIMDYFKGDELTNDPVIEMAEWSKANGYCSSGTDPGFFPAVSEAYGLDCKISTSSYVTVRDALINDELIVISVPGHYMVLSGIAENGNIIVSDPDDFEIYKGTFDEERFNNTLGGYWIWTISDKG